MPAALEIFSRRCNCPRTVVQGRSRRGMTLVEVVFALTVCGLLMLGVTRALVETASLSIRTTSSLEHARNSRELIEHLSQDVGEAQILILYPSFTDRSTERRAGELGNYLAVHWINSSGTIIRTIGYYAMQDASGTGWVLYRHDSADGVLAAGTLPAASTAGTHRPITRAVRLPDSNCLFRNVLDRGVILRGEFGTAGGGARTRTELIQCAISTRS
jgi:prepilin-type N-terminal cleavage/methylation domain-containing protein